MILPCSPCVLIGRRRLWTALLVLMLLSSPSVFARGIEDDAPTQITDVRVLVPNGAPLAAVALLDGETVQSGYRLVIEVAKSADVIAARIISEQADFAVVPSNLAAALWNKEAKIRMAGPLIWGLLYLVSSDNLDGWADLKGRRVNMIGRGLTPDITLRHLLTLNGINPDEDVEISYASSAVELAPAFLSGKSQVSMMPEPMITTVLSKKPDTRVLIDIQEEWSKWYGSSYPQASLVVTEAFRSEHPGFTSAFFAAVDTALDMAIQNPAAAGRSAAALAPEMKADVFAAALPRMNLDFVPAAEARTALDDYFSVLHSFDPAVIGGMIPGDDFYIP